MDEHAVQREKTEEDVNRMRDILEIYRNLDMERELIRRFGMAMRDSLDAVNAHNVEGGLVADWSNSQLAAAYEIEILTAPKLRTDNYGGGARVAFDGCG